MRTSAVDVSIHAVSPLSIFDGGPGVAGAPGADGAGAVAVGAAGAAGVCANATDTALPRASRATSTRKSRFTVEVLLSSDRTFVAFAGADTNRRVHRVDEDLAVADVPGLRRLRHHVRHLVGEMIGNDDLDLDLRQEIDGVLTAAIELGVTLLPAEAPDLRDRHADHADSGECFLDVIELERLDDRFDLLHRTPPARLRATDVPYLSLQPPSCKPPLSGRWRATTCPRKQHRGARCR